jgi:predicted nucleotidyltransferase
MLELIEQHRKEVDALCRKYGVARLEVFGSATNGSFDRSRSDLDFVVEFSDLKLSDAADRYLGLLVDLEDLFGLKIDLVSYRAIRNPYFKQVVDQTRVPLYAA